MLVAFESNLDMIRHVDNVCKMQNDKQSSLVATVAGIKAYTASTSLLNITIINILFTFVFSVHNYIYKVKV